MFSNLIHKISDGLYDNKSTLLMAPHHTILAVSHNFYRLLWKCWQRNFVGAVLFFAFSLSHIFLASLLLNCLHINTLKGKLCDKVWRLKAQCTVHVVRLARMQPRRGFEKPPPVSWRSPRDTWDVSFHAPYRLGAAGSWLQQLIFLTPPDYYRMFFVIVSPTSLFLSPPQAINTVMSSTSSRETAPFSGGTRRWRLQFKNSSRPI